MAIRESIFQRRLIKEIKKRLVGAIVTKLDPVFHQGIPDLLILFNDRWAMLECKRSAEAPHRPNQDYWVKKLNAMSFAAFIYPENKEAVLNDMEQALQPRIARDIYGITSIVA